LPSGAEPIELDSRLTRIINQYYYVPENVAPGQQHMPVLRSPLAGRLEQGLAYGNF